MKTVVIIGAGPAGLTTAYELLASGQEMDVRILEATNQIGGISQTVRHEGNRMDIGGHRFFSKSEQVMDWWLKMMPAQGAPTMDDAALGRSSTLVSGGPDPEQTDRVMLVRNRVSRIYYNGKFFDYPISMKMQTFQNMGLATTIRAGFSYLYSTVRKLPETSLENFYINRFGRVLYSMFFEGYTEKVWGRHPRDISPEWGSQRVKGLSILAVLKDMLSKIFRSPEWRAAHKETSLIESFYYPKFGPGQLWELVADRVREMGGTISMQTSAVGIRTSGGRVTGVETLCDGKRETIACDECVSSMPIRDLVASMEQPPETVAQIAHDLPYRDFVTVGLLVNELALKNETEIPTLGNIVPDCWIYVQDTSVKLGRIQIFNNWSPYMVQSPADTVWIGLEYFCNEGDDFWNMEEKACIDFAVQELIRIGVLDASQPILSAHRERILKAYPAYFDSYDQLDTVIEYLDGYENLFCVGRNGQHRYNNMDHSMLTGFETANNILKQDYDKKNIWNVNTEAEYHEQKK